MNLNQVSLNSLNLYFNAKRSALRCAMRARTPLSVEQFEDLRIHYSNYFIYLVSAFELIREVIPNEATFISSLKLRFKAVECDSGSDTLGYVCELRNAIVHRGLDICASVHFEKDIPMLIAPNEMPNRNGKITYKRSYFYLIELIKICETVFGPTIDSHLDQMGDFAQNPNFQQQFLEYQRHIDRSDEMPEWCKEMALEALEVLDFQAIHQANLANLRALLKPIPV